MFAEVLAYQEEVFAFMIGFQALPNEVTVRVKVQLDLLFLLFLVDVTVAAPFAPSRRNRGAWFAKEARRLLPARNIDNMVDLQE